MPMSLNQLKSTAPRWANYQPNEADARANPNGHALAQRARELINDVESYKLLLEQAKTKLNKVLAEPTSTAEDIKKAQEDVNTKMTLVFLITKRQITAVNDVDASGFKPMAEQNQESSPTTSST